MFRHGLDSVLVLVTLLLLLNDGTSERSAVGREQTLLSLRRHGNRSCYLRFRRKARNHPQIKATHPPAIPQTTSNAPASCNGGKWISGAKTTRPKPQIAQMKAMPP